MKNTADSLKVRFDYCLCWIKERPLHADKSQFVHDAGKHVVEQGHAIRVGHVTLLLYGHGQGHS